MSAADRKALEERRVQEEARQKRLAEIHARMGINDDDY
jgi:hypothetical protein